MAYIVKEADVIKEKDIMVGILTRNRQRPEFDYSARYDWVYLNNPLGKAKAWIIWNEKEQIPVGFTGVFPREIYVRQKKYLCWNCGDFSIEKKYRTLGVALKLRKAAKQAVDEGNPPFLYAHPNERMEVIHLKAGHHKIADMKRYALPVRANKALAQLTGNTFLANTLAMPINLGLSWKYRFSTFMGLHGRLLQRVNCTEKHEDLFLRMIEEFPVVGSRDRKYLNWKFGQNPNRIYQQFDMYYKDNLVGTVFFVKTGIVIHVIDVLIDDFKRFGNQLFRFFVNELRKKYHGINAISFILQEYNPFIPELEKIGFKLRHDATSAAIAYANPKHNQSLSDTVLNGENWFMTVGDRDA